MAYSLVTADNLKDLLAEILIFATANGWTTQYDNSVGAGANGAQIGLYSGNCKVALGENSNVSNPEVKVDTYPNPDVNVNDYVLRGSLCTVFNGVKYWGHTGSPVTVAGDADAVQINDLEGPFSEVHFFGDADSISVIVRSTSERWTHFGFGTLDRKGMTTPKVAYLAGQYHQYWNNAQVGPGGIFVPIKTCLAETGHNLWWWGVLQTNAHYFIPDNVFDPAFGVADNVIWLGPSIAKLFEFGAIDIAEISAGGTVGLLDHIRWSRNKPTTGGVPLLSAPIILHEAANLEGLSVFCGDMPGQRFINISNLEIGTEISYGPDVYLPFPLKRRNIGSYDGGASTSYVGIAYKKVT